MTYTIHSFSSSNLIAVYSKFNNQIYDPQAYARTGIPCDFMEIVHKSKTGLTGGLRVKGPGAMVVPVLDRHHQSHEVYDGEPTMCAVLGSRGELIPVELDFKDGYITMFRHESYKPAYYQTIFKDDGEVRKIKSNIGAYNTVTVLTHYFAHELVPFNHVTCADDFKFRSSRVFEIEGEYHGLSSSTDGWYLVTRRPGHVSLYENMVFTIKIDEDEVLTRSTKNIFEFREVQFRYVRNYHDDLDEDTVTLRAEHGFVLGDPETVSAKSFDECDTDFITLISQMYKKVRELEREIYPPKTITDIPKVEMSGPVAKDTYDD